MAARWSPWGTLEFTFSELNPATYHDFERLAAKQGSCWCMYYQRPAPIGRGKSAEEVIRANRRDKKALVRKGRSHAILVYDSERPVGWCQYGVADELPRIDAGRGYKKVGRPAGAVKLWRITCFFVERRYRGRGIAKVALHAALQSIAKQGGGVVEAYPVVSERMARVPEWRWFGTPPMFKCEGFVEVAPLGTSGVLMRRVVRAR
jgi:GNAT superfamily N-acetyltransferase